MRQPEITYSVKIYLWQVWEGACSSGTVTLPAKLHPAMMALGLKRNRIPLSLCDLWDTHARHQFPILDISTYINQPAERSATPIPFIPHSSPVSSFDGKSYLSWTANHQPVVSLNSQDLLCMACSDYWALCSLGAWCLCLYKLVLVTALPITYYCCYCLLFNAYQVRAIMTLASIVCLNVLGTDSDVHF